MLYTFFDRICDLPATLEVKQLVKLFRALEMLQHAIRYHDNKVVGDNIVGNFPDPIATRWFLTDAFHAVRKELTAALEAEEARLAAEDNTCKAGPLLGRKDLPFGL